MRKVKNLLIASLLALITNSLLSQSTEFGVVFNTLNATGKTLSEKELIDVSGSSIFLDANFGFNLPIYSFTDEVTIGALTGLDLGICILSSTSNGGPGDGGVNIALPIYLTLRYGANSNKRSDSPVGIGIGIGYQYLGYIVDASNSNPEDDGLYGFIKPTIIFEFVLKKPGIKLRIEKPIAKMTKTYKTEEEIRVYPHGGTTLYYTETQTIEYGYDFQHLKISFIVYVGH